MEPARSGVPARVVVALVTGNYHTVCAACFLHKPDDPSAPSAPTYALFDPMPGMLWTGLSADDLVHGICETLGVRAPRMRASSSWAPVIISREEANQRAEQKKKRRRQRVEERGEVKKRRTAEEEADGVSSSSSGSADEDEDDVEEPRGGGAAAGCGG